MNEMTGDLADSQTVRADLAFLNGGGEMGALMRAHDWSTSPLGPPEKWPESLRAIVALMINSRYPMFIAWGPELAFLYNDGYTPIFGAKHPNMLGRPFKEAWTEIWDDIWPLIERALAGEATYDEDLHLVMERNGYPEDTWYSFSYSPVRDESGEIAGMFCACSETTKRVMAASALRESEARLRALTDHLPGGIVYQIATDSDGQGRRFLYMSQRHEEFTGVPAKAVLEDASIGYSLVLEDDREILVQAEMDSIAGKGPLDVEVRYRHVDGDLRWCRIISARRAEPDGSMIWDGIQIDITERKRALDALRESEQRFREQFENANDFIFTTDLEMRITSCNPAVARALQRMPDELIGHRISDYTPPETWEHNKAMLADKLAGKGDTTRYEVEVFDRNGERMMWEINSRLIRDASGAPLGLHAIGRDVSERHRNERLLMEARTRAEADAAEQAAILGQLAEGVIVTDAEGRITFVNDAATRLHGVAALDVEPMRYSETYHLFREDGSPCPFDELPLARAVMAGETVRDERWRIRRPDGSEVLAIGNAQPVLGPDREPIGAVLTIRDDTARNAAEQALRELNETLEERVERRTAELEQAQDALRQSQKLEAMGQLTGGVAHDFNNLLTPILGSLDLLQRRGVGDEREQRLIDGALQSAERAKLLVQRLLAFARRQPLKTVAVDVGELIGGMAELVGSTCGPNIKVSVALDEGIAPALADPNQLEMAILNLSVNARDAMPDGGRLTLSATAETVDQGSAEKLSSGRYIRISVADTGTGMDEATLHRAIEPFFSTKGIGRGTGLGLSMVHGLASQLGGTLKISSNPGLGTNVELWLPASEAPVVDDVPTDTEAASEVKAGSILLVDDEVLVRSSTADMLTELGYDVVEASTAEDALRKFESDRFDLLVTDHLMPGMNGVDLIHALRQRQQELPVLIVSGYAEIDGIPQYLPRLTKPFRQADLAAAIAEIFKDESPVK